MADWYLGSAQWTAVTAWAALTSYSIGDLRRQLAAPTVGNERVFRCTTAGVSLASEPSWTLTKGGTTTEVSGPVWTEVTGNSTYGWTAAGARWSNTVVNWTAAGDRVFVASTHSETIAGTITVLAAAGTVNSPVTVISVDPAGSTPPVAADYLPGATLATSTTNTIWFGHGGGIVTYGVYYKAGSSSSSASIEFNPRNHNFESYFRVVDGLLELVGTGAAGDIKFGLNEGYASTQYIVLENTPVKFSNAGQTCRMGGNTLEWRNTASATQGTVPTTLFTAIGWTSRGYLDGLDLSAFSGTLSNGIRGMQLDVVNCRTHASLTPSATPSNRDDMVRMTNCGSGATNYKLYKRELAGVLTEEATIIRTGGASDGTTGFARKVVTTADARRYAPFKGVPMTQWVDSTGGSKTITVEMVNDGTTLTNQEVWLEVEYLGSSSYPIASGASSFTATPLTTAANLSTSSETWTTTGLGSPVKQYTSLAVTPNMKGYFRITPCFGRASATIYYCPKPTVS